MCERRLCHDPSVPATVVVPSGCSACNCARKAVRSPHWSCAAVMPIWPRNQPSLSSTVNSRRARPEQAGDVVGLDLEPLGVLGEPGRQLQVPDPATAEEHLVEAVRRGVQPRPDDRLRR